MRTFSKNINQFKVLVPINRYVCKILDIKECQNKEKTKDMVVIELDIEEGNYATCFSDKPLKKYFVDGEYFERNLAGFCLMVRQSNNMSIDVKVFNPKEFIGLKVGAFITQKEGEYKGNLFLKNEIVYFCTVEDCLNFKYEPVIKHKKDEDLPEIDAENMEIPF
ncbi:MAG: hypothetical protein WC389_20230 [Lutibacter sp.]|jgi:membrane protease subunit (stomatin/prohibitin family)